MGYIAKASVVVAGTENFRLLHMRSIAKTAEKPRIYVTNICERSAEFECVGSYGEVNIDCNAYAPNGTEEEAVKLFLELAQMEDEISIKARVVVGETDGSLRLQTPLEVAEAFRDGRIEL